MSDIDKIPTTEEYLESHEELIESRMRYILYLLDTYQPDVPIIEAEIRMSLRAMLVTGYSDASSTYVDREIRHSNEMMASIFHAALEVADRKGQSKEEEHSDE